MCADDDKIRVAEFNKDDITTDYLDMKYSEGENQCETTAELHTEVPEKIITKLEVCPAHDQKVMYRKAYHTVKKALTHFNVVILVGIRKTGKTTILEQLRDDCNGYYLNFKGIKNMVDSYVDGFRQTDKELLLYDEVCYLESFDTILSTLDQDCYRNNKKAVITSSSYGSLRQLSQDFLGGGRSCVVELFPLSFEEYLLFSNKIDYYGEVYEPTQEDILNFYKLEGIPDTMRFTINDDYILSTITEVDVATYSYDREQRDYLVTARQTKAVLDILAYTLNYKTDTKQFEDTESKAQGYNHRLIDTVNSRVGNMQASEVAQIILFLLHHGFLFIDLIQTEDGCQSAEDVRYELMNIYSKKDLECALNRHTFSAISPLLYTRLLIDLENIVDSHAPSNHLQNVLFGLAVKSEDIYNTGFLTIHCSCKVNFSEKEVDLYSYNGILLELKIDYNDKHHLLEVLPDIVSIRILTCGVDENSPVVEDCGYYKIHYPTALLMLSNKSIYDLPVLTKKTL